MSTPTTAHTTIPRSALLAAAALVLIAVISTAAVRLSGTVIREPDAAATVVRQLRFEDRPDGSIAVFDGLSKEPFDSVRGEAGFVRGTLRGLHFQIQHPQSKLVQVLRGEIFDIAAVRVASSASISRLKVRPIGVRASHCRYSGSDAAIWPMDHPAYLPKSRTLPDGLPGGVTGVGAGIW